jgi:hypothetical protein
VDGSDRAEHHSAFEGPPKRLIGDRLFAARMAYCGPRGIPLSQFLGWEQSDQDAALAWQTHEALRCPGCGTHPDDKTSKHFHINICPTCVQMDTTGSSEAAKAKGAHLATAPGARSTCTRCQTEARANRR